MTDPLLTLGWDRGWERALAAEGSRQATPGRVVRHDAAAVLVGMEAGQFHVNLGGYGEAVAVGDWVAVTGTGVDDYRVGAVLPRRSLLRRRDPIDEAGQLLAANVDHVLVVAGLDRPVKSGRLQRFVALAADAGAVPVVVLTKTDLLEDPDTTVAEVGRAHPGVEVIGVSVRRGHSDRLDALVRDRTVVLVGESGAGKSTLVNLLMGHEVADTGSVRAGDAKGRHTTTARHLHVLPRGGCLIDTPGIRSVGLWVDPDSVMSSFGDIEDFASGCKFRDCRHDTEPGCAVRDAVQAGDLDGSRVAAWATLQAEADATALRADVIARRRNEKRFGRIAREAQRLKRPRG